ncbi:polysaccharide deacetylase family protein [Sphingomonas sp. AOB5]|uniref:polysaccharide deacetylase family protein n=1 Tax=Sphingomonas sp. AOB5 TaxID=3034017 RepID=UPI0023F9D72A|nr:polysaccharide deacetylase family protein [Sphingomonas sp. AOB5]MDF7777286.1 polysaccharide deacetylase family protein [Sphingomonas sp. AOB5]
MIRLVLFVVALMFVVRADPVGNANAVPAAPPEQARKLIAITFDDAPRAPGAFYTPAQRAEKLIAVMREARVTQAAFFVNSGRVNIGDGDEARIAAYVAAGHVIANHTANHPRLSGTSAEAYLADIDVGEKWLKPRAGYRPWFRYPFLDEGGRDKVKRDAIREGLKARGLRNGYVTVDGSDWNMEALAVAAVKAGKTLDMDAFRDLYVETHLQSAEFTEALTVRTLGRSAPQVLLLHETDIAALFLGDLIKALRANGWEVVTADDAFADPIYQLAPDTPFAAGTLTEAMAWEKGITGPRWYDRNDMKVANPLFAQRVLHENPAP